MPKDSSREAYFPLIEKKYGEKMAYWFKVMAKLEGKKYPEQIAHLKENFGFSQAHANALVMYSRGSESSKRFSTPTEFYKSIPAPQAKTIKAIFKAITTKFPQLELVIAWNQPMVKLDKHYIFGASASIKHVLIAPWDQEVLKEFAPKFKEGNALKKTIQLPIDWEVNEKLIQSMIKASLANLKD
jgi:uncharacterized protein YdhG (YjbR/CyaY superfamily)